MLAAFTWSVTPEIFEFGFVSVRWYGLLFALPFIIGYYLVAPMFQGQGRKREDLDALTLYMILGTVVGARLGHCFFYDLENTLADPMSILRVWDGGLASHGAAIGILTGMWLFVRRYKHYTFPWLADRVVLVVALAGTSVRIGNFFNSEIYGVPTDLPWGVIFELRGHTVPHHPTQLYEALAYALIFLFLWLRHKKLNANPPAYSQLGLFMILTFTARFFIEFVKQEQGGVDTDLALKMGQLLSLPFIAIGAYLYWRSRQSSGTSSLQQQSG